MKRTIWMNFALSCLLLIFGCACALGDNISLCQDRGFHLLQHHASKLNRRDRHLGNLSSSAVLTAGDGPVLGTFTIAATAAEMPLTMSLAHPPWVTPNFWRISGGPLSFSFSDGPDTLTGNLHLVDLAQAPGMGMTANLTLDFPTSERLACLLSSPPSAAYPACPAPGPSSITAAFDHGTVDAAPTPEPASLGLFGIGLFGLAFALRYRLKAMAR